MYVLLFYYRFNYQPFFLERRNEKTIVQNLQREHKEGFNYISYRDHGEPGGGLHEHHRQEGAGHRHREPLAGGSAAGGETKVNRYCYQQL